MKQLREDLDLVINENGELSEIHTGDLVEEPRGKLLHIKNGQKGVERIEHGQMWIFISVSLKSTISLSMSWMKMMSGIFR